MSLEDSSGKTAADPSSDDPKCPTCAGAKKKKPQQVALKTEDIPNEAGDRIVHIETGNNGTQYITVFHGVTGDEIGHWVLPP
jgi:hypothetical protein